VPFLSFSIPEEIRFWGKAPHCHLYFIEAYTKELLPHVRGINSSIRKFLMKCGFQCGRLFGIYHRVGIKVKWNTGITKLSHTVIRFQSPCKPDLHDILAKRSDIGDDVNISPKFDTSTPDFGLPGGSDYGISRG